MLPYEGTFDKAFWRSKRLLRRSMTIDLSLFKCWTHNFLSFWAIFCPFLPNQTTQKTKILKKAFGDVINLNLCNKKHNHMMYPYSDMECDRHSFLSSEAIFCSFTPLVTTKTKIYKKCKNCLEILSFYHKSRSYHVWFLRYKVQKTEFFIILDHLLPFDPTNKPKNQTFEKIKKTPEVIIILQLCTTNDDHMMYRSWDIKHDRQKFLSFWAIFCPFITLTAPKIKLSKKWIYCLEISSFNTSVPKIMIICFTVPELWYMNNVIVTFSFWAIFCPFTP